MLSHDFTLNDFVYPIPICQPEADLDSILDIFRQLNCKLLAIPRDRGNWGIISSEDLLSLMAKSWLQKKTAVVSSHSRAGYRENTPNLSTKDLNFIIKPAIIYQAETKLPEFLSSLQQDYLSSDRDKCLIVNATGELQGRLNLDKMLKYLASKFNRSPASIGKPGTVSNSLLGLIDSIALPLKIETVEGENFYHNFHHNKCWRELVDSSQDVQARSQPDTYIATWWMEQQLSEENQNKADNGQRSKGDRHGEENIDFLPLESSDLASQPSAKIGDRPAGSSISNDRSQTNSQLSIEIEQGQDWNYIKFPLTEKRVSNGDPSACWLVLATKLSLENLQHVSAHSSATRNITDKLLGTVAHELRSPLTGIVGLSSLLQAQKLGKLNQRQTRYVELISNSGQKMMSIIKDLTKLTSLTTEQLQLKPELVNLESLSQQTYQQVLSELQLLNEAKSDSLDRATQLHLDIEPGSATAIADPSRLSSILAHLITETIQFSEADTLSIRIENLPESTAIAIGNSLVSEFPWSSASEESTSTKTGLNLIIAKYLAQTIKAEVKSVYRADRCQFTLLLPQDNSLCDRLSSNSLKTQTQKNLTILCLYPEPEAINPQRHCNGLDFDLKNWSYNSEQQSGYQHRVIEAEGLEQADLLARIWQLDVIVLDGYQIADPSKYLRSLIESESLSALPLITLDARTTEAANQIMGLNVYPYLLPAKHRSVKDLMQVIQIATRNK